MFSKMTEESIKISSPTPLTKTSTDCINVRTFLGQTREAREQDALLLLAKHGTKSNAISTMKKMKTVMVIFIELCILLR